MNTVSSITDRLETLEAKIDQVLQTLGNATHREITEKARELVNEALSDYANCYSDDFVEHSPDNYVTR